MKSKWTVVLVGVFLLSFDTTSFAEMIYLKNGKKIRGQIVEKNDKQVKVDISGVKITYYSDEIDHIEAADNQSPSGSTTVEKPQPTASPSSAANEKPIELQKQPEPSLPSPLPTMPTTTVPPSLTPPPPVVSPESTSSALPQTSRVSQAAANITDAKKSLILELIEVSGTKETMTQMFNQIVAQAPVEQAANLKSVLNINEIISRLVPIYDKYFTDDELKELIAFYKGETGRKLIKVMPLLMEDSMNASMAYFQEKMPAQENKKEDQKK